MCPASTSTATPSGSRHSVTMTLRSEPSGFTESTRLPLASRTNKRPVEAPPTDACSDFEDLSAVMFCPFIIKRVWESSPHAEREEPPHAEREGYFSPRCKRGVSYTHREEPSIAQGDPSNSDSSRYRARSAVVTITASRSLRRRTPLARMKSEG